jgi:hypothetical protein
MIKKGIKTKNNKKTKKSESLVSARTDTHSSQHFYNGNGNGIVSMNGRTGKSREEVGLRYTHPKQNGQL